MQIDTDSLFIITSTLTAFPVVPTSMTLNDLKPQNRGFSEFFAIPGSDTHFKRKLLPRPFEIDHDNLRMKCFALNVDFNGVRFDP